MSDCITDDDCDVFRTGAPAKNHCGLDGISLYPPQGLPHAAAPVFCCAWGGCRGGDACPPEAEVFEIVHNPRLLTCYALCQDVPYHAAPAAGAADRCGAVPP